MRKIQINVVGTVSDKDELNEIENIAKVFVIEERVIDLTEEIVEKNILKSNLKPLKKSISRRYPGYDRLQYLTVRGLN